MIDVRNKSLPICLFGSNDLADKESTSELVIVVEVKADCRLVEVAGALYTMSLALKDHEL